MLPVVIFIRLCEIETSSVVDPYSLNPDPDAAFQVNPDTDMDSESGSESGSRVLMTKN
jgi:hypothetical protein